MIKCKTCKFWKNKQRDLDYSAEYGICTGLKEYGDESQVKIKPHEEFNLTVAYKYSNADETLKEHEYELCTYKNFGCNKGR